MRVILDDDLIIDSEVVNPDAIVWKLKDFTNWYSSAPVRVDITPLPGNDGGFEPERVYRSPKTMTIEGFAWGGTPEEAEELVWERIAALSPRGQAINLRVEGAGKTKLMKVWLASNPQVMPFGPNRARFQIALVAADPRKYGEPQTITSGVAGSSDGLVFPLFADGFLDFGSFSPAGLFYIRNDGTADSFPVFKIRGAVLGGFRIGSDGVVLEYSGDVPGGTELTLSPYAGGRASLQGADVTHNIATSNWVPVGPKETRTFIFNPLGSTNQNALISTTFSDAWW